ncbi:MAG: flagellar biosynthesis protein FlhB [Desulfobulbaceae bacterium]|nr:MAG: flagellar biosynthesis protein FlhB [Desulfobulbaceae bacterium]
MAEETPSGGERTEAPSAKRRADFRDKGQVAQSKEINTAALMTITLLFWFFYMPYFFKGITELIASIWNASGQYTVSTPALVNLTAFILENLGKLLAPLFITVLVVGFFSSVFQFGWLFTAKPLEPDLSKFDPIKGIGRMFSKRSLVELLKSLFKVILIAWIAYSTVLSRLEEALILIDTSAITTLVFLGKTAALILAKVCALLIVLAVFDFMFVKWEMEEKMKMTKQEVKEEYKETEGDPYIKSQIRSIQQEMARRRMMAEVPEADVVITNPTHLSIAVKYDSDDMEAPQVVAKGAELVALKIREIAKEHDIPIMENPPVARLLFKIELGATIPESLFKAVAEILAHVYSLKGTRR